MWLTHELCLIAALHATRSRILDTQPLDAPQDEMRNENAGLFPTGPRYAMGSDPITDFGTLPPQQLGHIRELC
ncbi:hypothetical protein DFJ77DRAFT_469480 [Powellomyces hirtus]|nr:hypothetical protein DFJ77DRAFT_481691 [Powellomyces hirtus]KAI8911277.1 hypothetical protein DFJ77DRAFT_469480 [Powellomyces hirtus]